MQEAIKKEQEQSYKLESETERTHQFKRKATRGQEYSSKESSPKRKKTSSIKKSLLDKKMSIREEQEKPYTQRVQSRKQKEINNISFKKISSREDITSARSQKQLEVQLKQAAELYQQDSICFSSQSMIEGNFSPLNRMKSKTIGYIEKYKRKYKRIPDTILQFYTIGKIIGRGAFGKVHLAIHKLTGQFVAIKSLPKKHLTNERQLRKVKQETALLKKIRHPCLVNLLQNFETQSHVLFVMELCAGGDLLSYVRRRRHLKQSVAKYIFFQIVNGIQHCHHKKIIHRDIKLENILLDAKGNVKICDFGVSKIVKQGEVIKDKTGTPAYIAPEVIMDKGYSYPVDVWSAGVVLYAMLEGAVPFRGEDMNELRKNILSAKYQMPEGISKEAKDLLRHILVIDPIKRYEIRDILEHKWMQDIDHTQFLFTPTQINLVKQEFFYVESLPKQIGDETFFTEHGLDSEPTDYEDKNETDKSYILAPFNSEESKVDFDFTEKEQKLMRPPEAIHFQRKVRQINRDYQATHCKELDNGVYHRFAYNSEEGVEILCHKEQQGEGTKKKGHSKKLSLNQEQISQIRGALNHSSMMESFDIKNSNPNSPSSSLVGRHESSSVVVNFQIAQEMEKMGFPKTFVIKSLKRKEYNHATTTYYLIVGSKQPNAFNLELE